MNIIPKKATSRDDLNKKQQRDLDIFSAKQRKHYRVHWAKYFNKYLMYKQPYIINGSFYHNIDDDIDMFNIKFADKKNIVLDDDSELEQ